MDLEKAFDSIPRQALMDTLAHHYGLCHDVVKVVWRMYVDACGIVRGCVDSFPMTMGVKQGCSLSPTAFGLYFDRVVAYLRSVLPYPDLATAHVDWAVYIAHFAV